MSLRRFAQTNHTAAANGSPRPSISRTSGLVDSLLSSKLPLTPETPSPAGSRLPRTPRTRISYPISPATSPSLSASQPFDWEAARNYRPPPYGSPLQSARIRALRKSEAGLKGTPARVVRKRSWRDRITSIPSNIIFELSMFPSNVPLPSPQKGAWIVGGLLHFTHMCIRISQLNKLSEEEIGWQDLYNEHRGTSWFDWSTPLTLTLIVASVFTAFRLFTRIKLYNLHLQRDPVASPNAAFVATELDFAPLEPPPVLYRIASWLSYQFSVSWRSLFNFKPPAPRSAGGARVERVQQLSMWAPGEFELNLFAVYSPAHALLWLATTGSNWIMTFSIMAIVGVQIHLLMNSYEGLLKDRQIIAAEVMHEYDEKFVIPRVFPVKRDKAVMTHQSEIVDVYE